MKILSIRYGILAADCLWGIGSLGLAVRLRYFHANDGIGFDKHFQSYTLMALVALVVWVLLYFEMGLDGFRGGWHFPAILSKTIVAVSVLMIAVAAYGFLSQRYYSRLVLFNFALLFFSGLIGVRGLSRFLLTSTLRKVADHRCMILGNGHVARELAAKMATHPELPFQVVGFLFESESEPFYGSAPSAGTPLSSIKTLQILDLLAKHNVRKLVLAMEQPNRAEIRKLMEECQKASIQVYLVPSFYDLYVSKTELAEIDGLPLLSLREQNPFGASSVVKRTTDIALSLGILFLVSPVLLAAALAVYRKKGKTFRAELRCGQGGIPFQMYRLNVDRHTPDPAGYERFLVRWSITELPQLWNVLRGDMSLVGPRPESAERLKYYSDWHRQRLKVRGGVTGLAQVHGLREHHSSEDKARFDLQYILNWSPLLDLSLLLETVWTLLVRGLSREPASGPSTNFRPEREQYLRREVADAHRT